MSETIPSVASPSAAQITVVYAEEVDQSRLRVRTVNADRVARSVAQLALAEGRWAYDVEHGGGVANKYGYPALTSAVFAASDPRGNVVVWMARLPANKVTYGGAAAACCGRAGVLYDRRYTDAAKITAAEQYVREAHATALAVGARP